MRVRHCKIQGTLLQLFLVTDFNKLKLNVFFIVPGMNPNCVILQLGWWRYKECRFVEDT